MPAKKNSTNKKRGKKKKPKNNTDAKKRNLRNKVSVQPTHQSDELLARKRALTKQLEELTEKMELSDVDSVDENENKNKNDTESENENDENDNDDSPETSPQQSLLTDLFETLENDIEN
eukprot:229390_1